MNYGIASLMPTVVLFVLLLITKRVMVSLMVSGILGAILLAPTNFLIKWTDHLQETLRSGFISWLCVVMTLFGIYIVLMERTGATKQFALWLSRFVKKRWQALVLTEILGVIIFIDDALNNVAVGTSMRKLSDSFRVPRTLLGYITISTSAPVCILVPISSWAVFNGQLMINNGVSVNNSPVMTFFGTFRYMFFGWSTLLILTLVIFGVFPLIGPVRKHQKLADDKDIILAAEDSRSGRNIMAEEFSEKELNKPHNPLLFIVPLLVMIIGTVLSGNDVVIGVALGVVAAVVTMLAVQKYKYKDVAKIVLDGCYYMVPLLIQLTLSTTLTSINTELGMPDFILKTVTPVLNSSLMPVVVFVFLTVYSSFGGGFWEMSILFMPVVLPMALKMGVNPFLVTAAVVSASAAGSSMYVCGDTEALVSSVMGTTPNAQTGAVIPFALTACAVSAILFLIAGFIV